MSRENRLVVWCALLFVAGIIVLLALDDALWDTLEAALVLYGPTVAVLGAYMLSKSAVRCVSFIGRQV
jgi:hypothetical protein